MSDRKSGYALLLATASIALTLILSVLINVRLVQSSERRSCETLALQIKVYSETPPPSPTGRALEQAYREQYSRYHCPGGLPPINPAPSQTGR